MGSSRVLAGDLGKTLARASTVGKPSKAYKATNAGQLGGRVVIAFRVSWISADLGAIRETARGFGQNTCSRLDGRQTLQSLQTPPNGDRAGDL